VNEIRLPGSTELILVKITGKIVSPFYPLKIGFGVVLLN
jgi:hypothetical protein